MAVAAGPVVGGGAVQQLDEAGGDLTAAVPALVDDEGLLSDLAVELAEEVVLAGLAGVLDVDVADLAVGFFLEVVALGLDPGSEAEVVL